MKAEKLRDTEKPFEFKSWRDLTPMHSSVGTMEHNKTGSWRFIKPVYENKVPACQQGCPAGNNIESWIKYVEQGDYESAYWHLKREQPFPAILGRVCFRFCQRACNRNALDQSVRINDIERFIGDQMPAATPHPHLPDYNGSTLAVIGSGPAGMAAAYFARLLGFNVTIYEKMPEPGGILRMGIPDYRLPREMVADAFAGLKAMGIEIRTHTAVGREITMKQLGDAYDHIFLGTGVHVGLSLGIPGETDSDRVMSGLDFLKRVAADQPPTLGNRAVVIGGGNTAIDAARTAVRLGAEVTVLYRRTENEMPAHHEEIAAAREEGVGFRFLAAPIRIEIRADGTIDTLHCCKMALGEPDDSGRRRPMTKKGFEFKMPADAILCAIGERADFSYLDDTAVVKKKFLGVDHALRTRETSYGKKVYAGGDIIDTPHTVIHAIAAGKRAAIAMDCERKGLNFRQVLEEITIGDGPGLSFSAYNKWDTQEPVPYNLQAVVKPENLVFDYFRKTVPLKAEIQTGGQRKFSFHPYQSTFTADMARLEAMRCLHCGRCTECDNCLVFCPDMSVRIKGNGNFGYTIDYDYCKGCGICAAECPRHAITMLNEETAIANEEV